MTKEFLNKVSEKSGIGSLIAAFLICCLFFATLARAQFIPINEVDGVMDSSSYGTYPYVLWERYFASYFADMYPQWTNQIYDVSQSGSAWQFDFQSNWEKYEMPYAATLTNSGNFYHWILANDNGGYVSNDVYTWGTNFLAAPPKYYNGSAVTNEGIFNSVNYNYYFNGAIPADTAGGDDGLTSKRQDAVLVLNALAGTGQFDLLHELLTNGVSSDISGARIFGFYSGGHPHPAGHLLMALWTLLNMNAETNIASVTFNWQAATASTNHCVASGLTLVGNALSGTIHFDRMGPGWDWAHGSYTNDATGAFTLMPFMANRFNWTIQVTNLPTGNYSCMMDGALIFNATDSQLASGVNLFTNKNGWIGAQEQAVQDAICDLYGVDHVTLITTHDAGSGGIHGVIDQVNYISHENNNYNTLNLRGTNLVAAALGDMGAMRTNSIFIHTAAIQTNHTFSIMLNQARYAPAHR